MTRNIGRTGNVRFPVLLECTGTACVYQIHIPIQSSIEHSAAAHARLHIQSTVISTAACMQRCPPPEARTRRGGLAGD